jgi:hypothetical protein
MKLTGRTLTPRTLELPAAKRDLAALGAGLERGVHLLEAEFGFVERAPEEADEDAAEPLCLSEAAASLVEGLDVEDVLAVENAGEEESAAPAKLAIRLYG